MDDSKKSTPDLLEENNQLRARCRELESRLKEDEERRSEECDFKDLIYVAGEGLLVIDHAGRILYANREAARISGYTEEQLVKRRVHDLVPPDELLEVLERLARRIAGAELPRRNESVLLHRDGSLIPLEVSGTSICWHGESVSMTMIRDITKRKEAEWELARNAEAQAVLYREVNHRVKNNLAAIIGVLLKEQRRAEEEGNTAYLPVLRSLVGRVMGLATVHGMLSAAEWRPLLIHELTAQVISAAVQSVPDPSLIRVQITPSPLLVGSEQAQHLALVINELAANSVKHALDRRGAVRIKVGISASGSQVTLNFSDDGPGFPDALVQDDFTVANVGFDLIRGIVRKSLRGELRISNDRGAVAAITFELQRAPQDMAEKPPAGGPPSN